MTLAIMAAGLGSRFGGLKQIEPVGPNGEFIIDYSIYDAIKAGFNKIVFVIKEDNYQDFVETIGKRIAGKMLTFKIKGKTYYAKTNKKGIATITIKLNLKVGKYKIKTTYGKTTISNKIFIK